LHRTLGISSTARGFCGPQPTKLPKSEPIDIVNDEKQKEKRVADQFFRSLLV
jgi:hypothetical protein